MYITLSDLLQFSSVIIGVITATIAGIALIININKKK